jgi:transcription initiation factor TFIIIB Brf1 subunit/transcription initiation factor TFIIB
MECSHCNSLNLVVDIHHGDTVCTECGTIVSEREIVNDYEHNKAWCYDTHAKDIFRYYDDIPRNENTIPEDLETFIRVFEFQGTFLANDILALSEKVRKHFCFKGNMLRASYACIIYIACKNANQERIVRAAEEIYTRIGVDPKQFYKVMKTITSVVTDLENKRNMQTKDSILRQIQNVLSIPESMFFIVLNRVYELDELRKRHRYLESSSPIMINAILIFMACKELKIKIAKDFTKLKWVSAPTLKKHTDQIKALWEKEKTTKPR